MEPNQSGVKTWQWVVTVVVIIVLIIIGVLVFGNKGTEEPVDTDATPTASVAPGSINRITMTDQYPGNVVYISSVQFAQPGWVAIHKDNGGQPGAVIGSARFAAGINPGKITLSESMIDGGTYYAMMHSDDGDATFDAVKDAPLRDASGNIIMKIFRGSSAVDADFKG